MNKLYTQITDLPFYLFVEVSVSGNLKHLVIEGEATDKELEEAWYEIQSQYAEAIGDNEQKYTLKLMKDLAIIEANYKSIVLLVEMLRPCYVEVFAKELNKLLHTNFKFDITKYEEYNKTLDRCLTRSKSLKVEYEKKALELEAMMKKREGKEQKPTKDYYYKLWNSLRLYHKLQMSIKDITTFDFCDFLQRMIKEAQNTSGK